MLKWSEGGYNYSGKFLGFRLAFIMGFGADKVYNATWREEVTTYHENLEAAKAWAEDMLKAELHQAGVVAVKGEGPAPQDRKVFFGRYKVSINEMTQWEPLSFNSEFFQNPNAGPFSETFYRAPDEWAEILGEK